MEVRNVEDCFKFRLLRKISPDKGKSNRSLEIAKVRIKEAETALKLKVYTYAVIESYTAMFHSARALLYKDGIQEKSHYAVYVYLREKYSSKIPLPVINFLNIHRTERHEALYGLEYSPSENDARVALEDAKSFLSEIEKNI